MSRTVELLRLIQACKTIEGRKKLQKIVHLLKEAGHPFGYRFGFHYHGPFSAELKGELDSLIACDVVCESEQPMGERRQFVYSSTPALEGLLEEFKANDTPGWSDLAVRLNTRPAQELEAASTIVYLARHGYTGDDLASQFLQLKPHLSHLLPRARSLAENITNTAPGA